MRAPALSSHHLQHSAGNGCQEQPSDLRHVLTAEILLYLHEEEKYDGCCTDSGITMISYLQCRACIENIMNCYHPVELNCHLTLLQVNYINPTLSLHQFVKESKQGTSFICMTYSGKSLVLIKANGKSRLSDPATGENFTDKISLFFVFILLRATYAGSTGYFGGSPKFKMDRNKDTGIQAFL